ncbi:MAG: hypothetical protein LBR90_01210 [Elusimicrobiota bacterium]|jgi:hypothetical protein|nr:hypothetical protein [Elusimicrobiota bacterium]
MSNKKIAVFFLTLVFAAGVCFAQAKKTTKAATPKNVPVTVIVMNDSTFGGPDASLNQGLENFLGVPLEFTYITRADALKDPKYSGFNLDYMPLYLLSRNAVSNEKFGEHISSGYLPATEDFIVFEKQTRQGVYAGMEKKPNLIELFVMSQCPYGAMAEGKIIDAQKLGVIPDNIKIDVRYIASPGRTEGEFSSLHGSAEWEEDVRQLIIKDKYPNKFWKYLEIRNKDYQSSRWDIAAEEAGINPNIFRKNWKRGVELLKKDIEYGEKLGVSASPTVIWEGQVVTDLNSLSSLPGLEGFSRVTGAAAQAAAAPAAQC